MTTLFFCESSLNLGGQELQALQQACIMKKQHFIPIVLCRKHSKLYQAARDRDLNVQAIPFRNALDLHSFWKIAKLVIRHKPAALICHSGHDSNLCSLALHFLAITGFHHPRPRLIRSKTYLAGTPSTWLYNRIFDHTLTPSEALKKQLCQANPKINPERISVLYPGIDSQALSRDAQTQLPNTITIELAKTAGPVVVHAAMLRSEKGHLFMLGVIRSLKQKYPNILYIAAGEGSIKPFLEATIKEYKLEKNAILAGRISPIAALMIRANVVVMPSLYEPLGMSQLEALALGIPVVVSNEGGLNETVTHGVTGWICPKPGQDGANAAWATTLSEIFNRPNAARKMAAAGQQDVINRFDVRSNQTNLLKFVLS